MRIHKALHNIVMRFSGMEQDEGLELYVEAEKAYKECLGSANHKVRQNAAIREENSKNSSKPNFAKIAELVLTKEEKAVLQLEKWPYRYGIAVAYILLVPKIKEYFEGGESEDGMGEMDPATFMNMMNMFNRFQNFQKK